MGAKHSHQSLIFLLIFLKGLQFVTTTAERPRRRRTQRGNAGRAFFAGVDQVFIQGTDNAVQSRIHFAYLTSMLARGLDDPAGTGINDRSDTTGLRIKQVRFGHDDSQGSLV